MGKDYYKILGVSKSSTVDEIKRAYKKLALKHHPDRNQSGNADQAKKNFQDLNEAFEVLSDKQKRDLYDQLGEEGLKGGGVPAQGGASGGFPGAGGFPFGGSGGARTFTFSTGGPGGGFAGFTPSDPNDIFSQFFNLGGGMPGGRKDQSKFSFGGDEDEEDFPMGGMPGGFHQFGGQPARPGKRRAENGEKHEIVKNLPVSLEDLFFGATKRLKITRRIRDVSGATMQTEKILEVTIKPGYKAGTKIKFQSEGDELPSGSFQDIVFQISEKDHPRFRREGDNLRTTLELTFVESLCGFSKTVTNIDGKVISVSAVNPRGPGEIKYPGQGMPISKRPGDRGNLNVEIKVQYPSSLTSLQKNEIKKIFK
ncbi:Protein psi1 [Neolecta irregularis DAH-3]|uniref:Protein psi1 n=1 Tax=Neolecta irregularis (strain DAH-3) TaxID=1198029 RepID=A0A1U7LQ72_NEOID|nr:Protein psi1 [Neolecta irregularis DAH-3]|eukprot:OLL24733.1 Protein psi1 [Neolecta irregularis DAH-3]